MKLTARHRNHHKQPVVSRLGSVFFILALASALTVASSGAQAKGLEGRIGLGASDIGPGLGFPALSVDWELNSASALELNFGIDTRASNNSMSLGIRYARNLFIEDNQFFFVFLGGGLMSESPSSGYMLEAGVGAKFFLSGLPNLSLDVGSGFRLESPGGIGFRTLAFGGFHYYF